MSIGVYFPTVDVEAAVDAAWELVGGFIPVPREQIVCPQCRHPVVHLSRMVWHHRRPSALDRCDVSFKCTRCSLFWTHGIPVPTTAVVASIGQFGVPEAHWRDVREALDELRPGTLPERDAGANIVGSNPHAKEAT